MPARDESTLVCTLENDYPVIVVRAAGRLTYASIPAIRQTVQKGFADHPVLLLIDVAEVAFLEETHGQAQQVREDVREPLQVERGAEIENHP